MSRDAKGCSDEDRCHGGIAHPKNVARGAGSSLPRAEAPRGQWERVIENGGVQ